MTRIIGFLKSERFTFAALLCVLLGQVVNFAYVFSQANPALLSQFRPEVAWLYATLCAVGLEAAILISILEGRRWVAAMFAAGFLTINLCWNHELFDQAAPLAIAKALIYAMLSITVWFFSDIVGKRITDDQFPALPSPTPNPSPKGRGAMAVPLGADGIAGGKGAACPDCGRTLKNRMALNAHKQFCKAIKAA